MTVFYRTVITEVGPDVADLLDGGILILFADGSPPELAEVSVLHRVAEGPTPEAPPVGATLTVGSLSVKLTAIGAIAWNKIGDLGHVVINFDGATDSKRPGELSAESVPAAALLDAVESGASITLSC